MEYSYDGEYGAPVAAYDDVDDGYDDGIPYGHIHDGAGRLLKDRSEIIDEDNDPEDLVLAVSKWLPQKTTSKVDWQWTSKVVWPDIDRVVLLKRLDIYESDTPKLQQATTDLLTSRKIRQTPGWLPVRSVFFLDEPSPLTCEMIVEQTGPPKRNKYRPSNKNNVRDFTSWVHQERIHSFIGADRIPGAVHLHVDYQDLPDRYFLNASAEASIGTRRLYHFAGYTATQYFILEKMVQSELLASEGGCGLTYTIEKGPILEPLFGWRLIGSFFGFDGPLQGSSLYTVYRRMDPFPRMLIQLDGMLSRAEQWDASLKFYAFDVPVPQSTCYTLQHCLLSIHSAAASVQRHRLTNEYPTHPWVRSDYPHVLLSLHYAIMMIYIRQLPSPTPYVP